MKLGQKQLLLHHLTSTIKAKSKARRNIGESHKGKYFKSEREI